MSIKRKLTLNMMAISFAAVVLTASTIMTYLIVDMRAKTLHELSVTAAIAADRNSAAIAFLDNERANKNMEVFSQNDSILTACVYDAQGAVFASYSQPGSASPGCPPKPETAMQHPGDLLTAFQPIQQNGQHIGAVFIAADTRQIDTFVHKTVFISLTSGVLVLAVTMLLTLHFQHAISKPILELADTARTITERGDYTIAARDDYHDETAVLAKAFNSMLSEVHKRDRELVQANETLEQKVTQRTQQLTEAKLRAEAASAAKSEFLRNMSHEFRTPLHALISFSAYGIKEHGSAERGQLKHYFEIMQSGAERLSRLVGEVLDLAKLEHGEHTFALQRADMRDLGAKAMELVEPLTKEKGIKLTMDCDSAHVIAVVCDQDKILQVMTNLLGNAIKFTPSGRNIYLQEHLLNSDMGPQVEVSVIDEGVGIPEGEKELIFESFRQSSRTNNGAGGTGLGLAICRNIVNAHQGRIWAENNPNGKGARVTFVMPATLQEGNHILQKPS